MARSVSPSSSLRSGVLARRVGVSFARVTIVGTVVCGLLLFFLLRVANSVNEMQRDEAAIRTGLGLAAAIREQYIHIAHTVIAADGSHVDHYHDWVQTVRAGTRALRSQVAETERWRLDRIEQMSDEIDVGFRTVVLPASLARDHARIAQVHQELDQQVSTAAGDADIVAQSVEARMSREHVDPTRVTRAAASTAAIGVLLLIALSMVSTRNLRNAVLHPLGALADAASRIGSGDLTARVSVSVSAEGELGLLARAFDQMAAQLSRNQQRLIRSERMAAIGQLAAGVAHEINNPVGVIRGYLRTMIPEADREELRKELRILDEEAAACQRIAEDLVAYARAPELSREDVDLGALVSATVERFEAVEQRAIRRLGESSERAVNVRWVAATHRDLQARVKAGTFREDLWYRLNVAPIRVPALRDRRDDIEPLVMHFLRERAEQAPDRGREVIRRRALRFPARACGQSRPPEPICCKRPTAAASLTRGADDESRTSPFARTRPSGPIGPCRARYRFGGEPSIDPRSRLRDAGRPSRRSRRLARMARSRLPLLQPGLPPEVRGRAVSVRRSRGGGAAA